MSLPRDRERSQLEQLAFAVRETFSARGHHIGQARRLDPAFGTAETRKSMARSLVLDAIGAGASQIGLSLVRTRGGGKELLGEAHKYRIRHASRDSNGGIVVYASEGSSLVVPEAEPSLLTFEQWIFGWTTDGNDHIQEMFVAEIGGWEGSAGQPLRLVVGAVVQLGAMDDLFTHGFIPSEEDLDLGEEDGGSAPGREA